MPRAELFVGNLSKDITRQDIEDVFDKYGRMIKCEVKNKDTGASFCFIEFEQERDAEVFSHFLNPPNHFNFNHFINFIINSHY